MTRFFKSVKKAAKFASLTQANIYKPKNGYSFTVGNINLDKCNKSLIVFKDGAFLPRKDFFQVFISAH